MTKYIDFSIDYDDNCECVDEFIINDEVVSINDESDVNPLIEKLKDIEGFFTSEHRTQVSIWWKEDETMDIRFRYYNEPDWGNFKDYKLSGIPSIEFEPELG